MYVLVTGSTGLIGSETVKFYCKKGHKVVGIDNDMRKYFFGSKASTEWNKKILESSFKDNYMHHHIDIRNKEKIREVFQKYHFDLIVHTAAQPSHDWAAKEPYTDFEVNAQGTLVLLENFRKNNPEAVFIFTSTNKVYGDSPNKFNYIEKEKRYELDPQDSIYAKNGFDETLSIDQSTHSLFGASKAAADILCQEYGRYFGLKIGIFRGGCLTGPAHSGTELHGFLAYLVKCVTKGKKYTIFGYKGKQVRDNIHSYDLVNAFDHFYKNPKCGEVYNIGGSRHSNVSILEAIDKIENITGKKAICQYSDKHRIGDHIWYISDVSKFRNHYPDWDYTYDTDQILNELSQYWMK